MTIEALRARYVELFGEEPLTKGVLGEMETALGLTLPDDLKEIAEF